MAHIIATGVHPGFGEFHAAATKRRTAKTTQTGTRALRRRPCLPPGAQCDQFVQLRARSEEHTSELQSLMRISYTVFCLKKKTNTTALAHTLQPQKKQMLYR